MAFTTSIIFKNVIGAARHTIVRVTADGATGAFDPGLGPIQAASYTLQAVASAATMNLPVIAVNAGVSGTATVGTIGMTNCVSGDIYHVHVLSGS